MTTATQQSRTVPDAVDYLRERFLSGLITRDELMHAFGNKARLSEVMNKRRPLSIEQIRRAHFGLGLDASSLLVSVAISDPIKRKPLEK